MGNEFRRRIVTPSDQDVHTGWRKWLCYMQQPGVTRRMKRLTNRRERREAQRDTETRRYE